MSEEVPLAGASEHSPRDLPCWLVICCFRAIFVADRGENDGRGALNGSQALGQHRGVACIGLNVVACRSTHFQSHAVAHNKCDRFGFRLSDSFGNRAAALCGMSHLVALCGAQHKRTYVT